MVRNSGLLECFGAVLMLALAGFSGYKWQRLLSAMSEVYDQKYCTVLNTTTDEWRAEGQKVCLPKVQINIVDDDRKNHTGETFAYKFLQGNSNSRVTTYEPDCYAWLKQFKIGGQVECWQSTSDPEVVKLDKTTLADQSSAYIEPIILTVFTIVTGCFIAFAYIHQSKQPGLLAQTDSESEA
mmetsp:Transcript_120818/g.240701  ORF Transcript_120818/g.240701 Transcript_120818/m.240701 type:complete len:182 (+) Transcript_120818:58-603(+)